MTRPYDLFVIFAEMRTGSNLLEASLNQVPGLQCHGECFNPHFVGYPNREETLGVTLPAREADPVALLDRLRAAPGLNGFRYFHDHDPRILQPLLEDPRVAKIVLTRNPAESYVSLLIARQTGQWKLGDARHLKTSQVRFDSAEFEAHLGALQEFQLQLMRGMQLAGQAAFYVDYEDIQDVEVLNGLIRFLGAPAELAALPRTLVKQNPEPMEEKVVNFTAMELSLARLDRFNLSRTPNFEPRRGPAVPSFMTAAKSGLLFMPIKAGPGAQVARWLAALDGAEPQGEYIQKTLRQWMRRTPGHRAFTVLRHPVARAHAAFCDYVLGGAYAEIREVLRRGYKLPLPPVDKVEEMDREAHRAAFLGFARFLKANLAGQTGVRIDAAWASQAAVIQGFAGFAQPDLVAREDRLAEDLGHLAATLGLAAPPLPMADEPARAVPLAEIYDEEIEAALRDAYQRDYVGFGFGPWVG